MNIVNKVTLAHMKLNRKRTLVTILGAVISTAMITAVVTLSVSFLYLMQRETISKSGLWHVQYYNVDSDQIAALWEDSDTESVALSRDRGFSRLEESNRQPYLFFREYNDAGFRNFPFEVLNGRLPEAYGEVVISEKIISEAGYPYQVGDLLEVRTGKRYWEDSDGEVIELGRGSNAMLDTDGELTERFVPESGGGGEGVFTIVGIVEQPYYGAGWSPSYLVFGMLEERLYSSSDQVQAYVALREVGGGMFAHAEALQEELAIEKFGYNGELLRYYGVIGDDSMRSTLYNLAAVVMGIIVLGSVSLIYNAFAISVAERARYLGMLSSIGATAGQKRNSVFFEGAVIGMISIPLGIFSGVVGIGITFFCVNPLVVSLLNVSQGFELKISAMGIVLTAIVSCLTIFISAFIPALRAAKMSPIDAIRQSADVKLTGKKVRTWKLTRKLFGAEGEIALKNLKRNKRRYQATVFSLVISIILFLSTSYFGKTLQQAFAMTEESLNYDISISFRDQDHEDNEQDVKQILSLSGITESADVERFHLTFPEESPLRELQILTMDDEALKRYAENAGADPDLLLEEGGRSAILVNTITYQDQDAALYVTKDFYKEEPGQELMLYIETYEDETWKKIEVGTVRLDCYTDLLPMGSSNPYNGDYTYAVVSRETFEELYQMASEQYLKDHTIDRNRMLYVNADDSMALQEEIDQLELNTVNIYNLQFYRKQQDQLLLLMAVFVYGFIVLITAICIANIFNTISTSIGLRKREFAMLRSVGMAPASFNRMIRYESIFYGMKALAYGLPLSLAAQLLIYRTFVNDFSFSFRIPWLQAAIAVLAVFFFVSITMVYATSKIKKENIIDGLKQDLA